MRSFFFTIFMLSLLLTSCLKKGEGHFWFLNVDKNYQRLSDVFLKYSDFFPNKESAQYINYTWSLDYDVESTLQVVFSFQETEFHMKKQEISNSAIAVYKASSDSLLVLNRFKTNENYGYPDESEIDKRLIEQEHYVDFKPVPNFSFFSNYRSNNTICKLKEDFTIYVLDAKPGIFLKSKLLTKGKYMPESWKNGYSRGVAINDERKEMIFWVIIW